MTIDLKERSTLKLNIEFQDFEIHIGKVSTFLILSYIMRIFLL